MKMIVGNRQSKENIDCFILSDNFDATTKNVETFDVDKTVLDHNPIGVTLIFKEIKVLKIYFLDDKLRALTIYNNPKNFFNLCLQEYFEGAETPKTI